MARAPPPFASTSLCDVRDADAAVAARAATSIVCCRSIACGATNICTQEGDATHTYMCTHPWHALEHQRACHVTPKAGYAAVQVCAHAHLLYGQCRLNYTARAATKANPTPLRQACLLHQRMPGTCPPSANLLAVCYRQQATAPSCTCVAGRGADSASPNPSPRLLYALAPAEVPTELPLMPRPPLGVGGSREVGPPAGPDRSLGSASSALTAACVLTCG